MKNTKKRFVSLMVLGLACLMMAPGCKKTGKRGAGGLNDDVIGGVRGEELGDFSEIGLGTRFDESMTPYLGAEFTPAYFDYDSARLKASERSKADMVADEMRGNSGLYLMVEGHCDERGDREYNMALGERRALAVRAYLIELGINSDRVQTKSWGEENPAAFGHDDASYQLNRRGEFKLFN